LSTVDLCHLLDFREEFSNDLFNRGAITYLKLVSITGYSVSLRNL